METIKHLLDLVLHLDKTLPDLVDKVGAWTFLVLFLIVFCETGLVVTPFLPGDSLLVAAGMLAAGVLKASWTPNIVLIILTLIAAALLGDNVNYFIGRSIGPKVFRREDSRWLKKKHLERTHKFFERYGGKAIIIARFVPIVRTFTPFVAGVGSMKYSRFLQFCLAGAVLWVGSLTLAGYFFGRLDVVRNNFEVVIIAIIVISLLPVLIEFIKAKRHAGHGATTMQATSSEETPK